MNKEYVCKRSKISEALNEIEGFETLMRNFNEKHNCNYNYTISLTERPELEKKWVIELKMTKNEK